MSKKVIDERIENINGEDITVLTIEPRDKKVQRYADRNNTTCPNCQSRLVLDNFGQWECTGDMIKIWEKEFYSYYRANEKKKVEILANFSNESRFLELYDMWHHDIIVHEGDKFDCGYTNEIFPLISACKERIPDPLYRAFLESKLGRELTVDELLGESELYMYRGQVLTYYRKGAKPIRIPWLLMPGETQIYI